MLKRLPWGDFTPDTPLGLATVANVLPLPEGYRPFKSPQGITPALSGILGGAAYIASDGTSAFLGGTATDIYRFSGGAWSSVLGSLTQTSFRTAQFGDNVVIVNGGAPRKFDLIGGTAGTLGGSPPISDLVATVRDQVFLAGNPTYRAVVTISGYNNAEGYTPGVNQSLSVPFPSGGDITGLAGGETGLILQQRSIKRATFTGDVTVWQFDEISNQIGCMAKGSVAQAGLLVFFLSDQGFKMTDRNEITPIGREKIDRTFFAQYSRSDIQQISTAVDPQSTTVFWAMPGTPGKIWAFDWTLQKWSIIEVSVRTIFSGFTANISLDAIDALYPGGIDVLPYSLDDPIFSGGSPLLLIADSTGVVGTPSGPNLAASLVCDAIEIEPGVRVRVRRVRAVSDANDGTVTLDVKARAGDGEVNRYSGTIRDNGSVAIRANGRHIGRTYEIPAGVDWSYTLGLDIEYEPEGQR